MLCYTPTARYTKLAAHSSRHSNLLQDYAVSATKYELAVSPIRIQTAINETMLDKD
jgi:hypothetical protein